MKYRVFSIPVFSPEAAESDLNEFLSGHVILRVERQFVADGENSFWTICVCYRDRTDNDARPAAMATSSFARKSKKVDYRDIVPKVEFPAFSRARALRREISLREGVPPYALFNDEQLAEIVMRRMTTAEQIAAVRGVGQSRAKKYADAFLEVLKEEFAKLPPTAPPALASEPPPPTPPPTTPPQTPPPSQTEPPEAGKKS